jgi:DNA excision repair protein ERCC-2
MDFWFPYDEKRQYQNDIILKTLECLKSKKSLIFSAPTGIGKTISVLAPALQFAYKNNLKVLFLTNRINQQVLPLKEFKKIKDKFCTEPLYAGRIISKKDLCPRDEAKLKDLEGFYSFCTKLKQENECKFYKELKQKLREEDKDIFKQLLRDNPTQFLNVLSLQPNGLCTHSLIKQFLIDYANLVVLDYNYLLNPFIRKDFFGRTGIDLNKCIVVFDESHNLPEKTREVASRSLSSATIASVIREIDSYKDQYIDEKMDEGGDRDFLEEELSFVQDFLKKFHDDVWLILSKKADKEREFGIPFKPREMIKTSSFEKDVDFVVDVLDNMAEVVEKTKKSRCRSVSGFLEKVLETLDDEENFVKFINVTKREKREYFSINIKCLDSSYVFTPILKDSYCVVCFSGTLEPTYFKKMLGFPEDTLTMNFPSPFSSDQRRYIIYPNAYADFTLKHRRENIEEKCSDLVDFINSMKGNVLVVFPSEDVFKIYVPLMEGSVRKKVFKQPMNEEFITSREFRKEGHRILKEFQTSKNSVMFTAAFGSYAEGVDYIHVLQNTIVVGFPFPKVNYERKMLTKYFNNKFEGSGSFLTYVLPGIQKSIQAAGRVIRDLKDRGVIIFYGKQFGKGVWRYGSYFNLLSQEIKDEAVYTTKREKVIETIKNFWRE